VLFSIEETISRFIGAHKQYDKMDIEVIWWIFKQLKQNRTTIELFHKLRNCRVLMKVRKMETNLMIMNKFIIPFPSL